MSQFAVAVSANTSWGSNGGWLVAVGGGGSSQTAWGQRFAYAVSNEDDGEYGFTFSTILAHRKVPTEGRWAANKTKDTR